MARINKKDMKHIQRYSKDIQKQNSKKTSQSAF
jgi:hypothetical protein